MRNLKSALFLMSMKNREGFELHNSKINYKFKGRNFKRQFDAMHLRSLVSLMVRRIKRKKSTLMQFSLSVLSSHCEYTR